MVLVSGAMVTTALSLLATGDLVQVGVGVGVLLLVVVGVRARRRRGAARRRQRPARPAARGRGRPAVRPARRHPAAQRPAREGRRRPRSSTSAGREVEADPDDWRRLVAAGGGVRRRARHPPRPAGDAPGRQPRAAPGACVAELAVPAYGTGQPGRPAAVGADLARRAGGGRRARRWRRRPAPWCCSSTGSAPSCCAGTPTPRRSCPRWPRRDLTAGFPSTTVDQPGVVRDGPAAGRARADRLHLLGRGGRADRRLARLVARQRRAPTCATQLVPELVQPRPTAFERAAAAGVEVTVAAPASFDGSGLTRAVLRGGTYRGARSPPGDAIALAVARQPGRRAQPRLLLHARPRPDRSRARRRQRGLARAAAPSSTASPSSSPPGCRPGRSCTSPPTTAWSTSPTTPGSTPTPRRSLREGVRALAGEPRARHVHAEPGAAADVLARWRAELGDRMRGPAPRRGGRRRAARARRRHRRRCARTGDVVAIATGEVAVVRRARRAALLGAARAARRAHRRRAARPAAEHALMGRRRDRGCPCGLPAAYDRCCGRFLAGAAAPTAELLMRSRYTAYARRGRRPPARVLALRRPGRRRCRSTRTCGGRGCEVRRDRRRRAARHGRDGPLPGALRAARRGRACSRSAAASRARTVAGRTSGRRRERRAGRVVGRLLVGVPGDGEVVELESCLGATGRDGGGRAGRGCPSSCRRRRRGGGGGGRRTWLGVGCSRGRCSAGRGRPGCGVARG